MKNYENDFTKRRQRKKAKCHASQFIIAILICGCFVSLICAATLPRGTDPRNYAKSSNQFSTIESDGKESDNPVDLSDYLTEEVDETVWSLILVNKWNSIPDNIEIELMELENGEAVDKRIYPKLQALFDAARSDGFYPVVVSGYRTTEKQQSLMDEKIRDYKSDGYSDQAATEKAEAWVAIPGTSEHQLGIAVDINADGINSTGYEVYEWLGKNAYKFGFINRYSPDKTEITGVINEPWHYRYVGIHAAAEIQKQDVCLEEYLNKTN